MPVIKHDGADLFYQVEGKGPPLLLIMGLGYPSDMWWRMLPWLTAHFTTVRFDNRGVGRTGTGAERPYSVERMALDARAVLHAVGFARAAVFGVSMGGTIAQELALSHPQAVDRLLLGCSHPGGAEHRPRPGSDRAAAEQGGDDPGRGRRGRPPVHIRAGNASRRH